MHERSRQSLYLRFLCLKRAVCSGVWEFAADFRFAIPEVRGKPRSGDQTLVLRFSDLQFCSQKLGCGRGLLIFPRTFEIWAFWQRSRCLITPCNRAQRSKSTLQEAGSP